MPDPFTYQPLDEHSEDIRILTLHPASLSNEILISIHHESFKADQSPEYEAISYAWGSPKKTASISIMDGDTKVLSVTQSLDIALQHLCHKDKARKLWIDAICIDQSNLEERGLQVQRMGKIYKRAKRVVVWLGPEGNDSAHAISLMRSLASKVEIDWDTNAMGRSFH